MNKYFAIKLLSLIFSGVSTFVYVKFFNYEEMNSGAIFGFQIIVFLPILMGVADSVPFLKLSAYALFGSTIGFMAACMINNVGIWPISTAFWVVLSLPSIILLNIVGLRIKNRSEDIKPNV